MALAQYLSALSTKANSWVAFIAVLLTIVESLPATREWCNKRISMRARLPIELVGVAVLFVALNYSIFADNQKALERASEKSNTTHAAVTPADDNAADRLAPKVARVDPPDIRDQGVASQTSPVTRVQSAPPLPPKAWGPYDRNLRAQEIDAVLKVVNTDLQAIVADGDVMSEGDGGKSAWQFKKRLERLEEKSREVAYKLEKIDKEYPDYGDIVITDGVEKFANQIASIGLPHSAEEGEEPANIYYWELWRSTPEGQRLNAAVSDLKTWDAHYRDGLKVKRLQ